MKKYFEAPSIKVSSFSRERVLTDSAVTDGVVSGEKQLAESGYTNDVIDVTTIWSL